jgi:hypothetical protein
VILLDGRVEAFSLGELLNRETAVIHVEKANPEIRGLYALINQQFCQNAWAGVSYINREQDLGTRLRPRLSYHPTGWWRNSACASPEAFLSIPPIG